MLALGYQAAEFLNNQNMSPSDYLRIAFELKFCQVVYYFLFQS